MGRIGRLIARRYIKDLPEDPRYVGAIDLCLTGSIAYMMRYDSVHEKASLSISDNDDIIRRGSHDIASFYGFDPSKLPWDDFGIDIVLECTGLFRDHAELSRHLRARVSRAVISAPPSNLDNGIVMDENEDNYAPAMDSTIFATFRTISPLAPAARELHDSFGIELLTTATLRTYAPGQKLINMSARKKHRGRTVNATMQVMPCLVGEIYAAAVRTPLLDGALIDITAIVENDGTDKTVNATLGEAAEEISPGILGCSEEDLTSVDIIGDSRLSTIGAQSNRVMTRAAKVMVWRDNKHGRSCCMLALAALVVGKNGMQQRRGRGLLGNGSKRRNRPGH